MVGHKTCTASAAASFTFRHFTIIRIVTRLARLTPEERHNIAGYLRNYHSVEMGETTTFRDITHILPASF